jgi:alpha-1,2-mannosyltransferase
MLPDGHFFLCAAGFTAVFVNVSHGQNGFLTAGLFAAAIASLGIRPWAAGVWFGLTAFKPQLGLLVPVALAAGGHWRTIAASTATVAVLAAGSTVLFGIQIWPEFLTGAVQARQAILDSNGVGYDKLVSVFAWLRLWQMPVAAAYAGQAVAAVLAAVAIVRLWRTGDVRLEGAALCIAALLATPFALDYDLMILAPAILLLAGREETAAAPYGATLLLLLWLVPLFARSAAHALFLPLANWALIGAFLTTVKRAPS